MASLTVPAPERLISSDEMTLTPKGRSLAVSEKRVAVTRVSWIVVSAAGVRVWDKEGKAGANANGNASRRA